MFEQKKVVTPTGQSLKEYRNAIDFSLLSPLCTQQDVERAANVAYKNRYRSLCVLPSAVQDAKEYLSERFQDKLRLGTVVGFPLGANLLSTKVEEARRAFQDGADYIDCVINLSMVKENNFAAIKKEISRLVRTARKKEINVIIETSALKRDEAERLCKICAKCKVDNVMTSTGFGAGGATPEVVEVLVNALQNRCGVKAAGGVSSREDVWNLLRAGATRIATSREV